MSNADLSVMEIATLPDADPAVVIEYTDPQEGFKGWLVIDGVDHDLCAGGLRVQKTLTADALKGMARNMSRKMRVWGMPINGAKSGIAYDPLAPGKDAAVALFMKAIKPYLMTSYSMGADLNTQMDTLERLAHEIGVPSIKMAIANAQNLSLEEYESRYALLGQRTHGDWTLGSLRAGWGVGTAALALLDNLGLPRNEATAAVQGFGTLAKASIVALLEAGVRIVAVADVEKCLIDRSGRGLDMQVLLRTHGTLLPDPESSTDVEVTPRETVLETACDVLLLEAVENTVTAANVERIHAKGVVPGANLAVADEAVRVLHLRNIPTLPCFVAGSGGSVAMNGLFGPAAEPSAAQVLDFIKTSMDDMVAHLLSASREQGITPTEVALHLVEQGAAADRSKPYAA
ncbi:MAG: Glu/Leu/Phe/Val dehydrogenase dimerization domain-containing protein [Acidihalobacter sp.]|uniref:Glu/Leu/Phe/Val dehydrogenase dimerization domain-containing protein n=1 Tax=Acidihalobacter sp. TaxID=1872108 RepID=UPI00307D2E8A